jgi:hypothetical protein
VRSSKLLCTIEAKWAVIHHLNALIDVEAITPVLQRMIADVATTIATGPTTAQTKALIVCDMQPDLLKSLPPARRQALLDIVIVTVDAVRKTPPSKIIWTGVRFLDPTFASEVSYTHRLYGALRRLYDSAPKGTVQWFVAGTPGTAIDPALLPLDEQRPTARGQRSGYNFLAFAAPSIGTCRDR